MASNIKYKKWNIEQKIEIIDKIKKGTTTYSISRKFSIPETNIRRWLKSEEQLRLKLKEELKKTIEIDHNKICRLCLEITENDTEVSEVISEKFLYVTNMKPILSDKNPNLICTQCFNDLENCYELRHKFIEKQIILREIECECEGMEETPFPETDDIKSELLESIIDIETPTFSDPLKDEPTEHPAIIQINGPIMEINDNDNGKKEIEINCIDILGKDNEDETNFEEKKNPTKQEIIGKPQTKSFENRVGKSKNENDKKFTCEICSKTFSKHLKLRNHYEGTHKMGKLYKCDICGFETRQRDGITKHKGRRHAKEKTFKCDECGKFYALRSQLTEHRKVIHEKKYLSFCQYCGVSFYNQHLLNNHINAKHKRENPLYCDICGYSTFIKFHLKTHIKTHMKREMQTCKICSAKVMYIASHMRAHKEYKYKCENTFPDGSICDRRYQYLKDLNEHIDVYHKMLQKYNCNLCSEVFKKKYKLFEHIRAEHLKYNWKCIKPGCKASLKSKRCLRVHIINTHKELSVEEKNNLLSELRDIEQPSINNLFSKKNN